MLALLFVLGVVFFGVWLITFPIRLLFRLIFGLVFGVIGFVLRLAFAPILLLVAVVGIAVAFVAALLALLAPLLPFAVVGLIAWAIYRVTRRSALPV
jgi:hypothetical protein